MKKCWGEFDAKRIMGLKGKLGGGGEEGRTWAEEEVTIYKKHTHILKKKLKIIRHVLQITREIIVDSHSITSLLLLFVLDFFFFFILVAQFFLIFSPLILYWFGIILDSLYIYI